jgi:hypothetical protein
MVVEIGIGMEEEGEGVNGVSTFLAFVISHFWVLSLFMYWRGSIEAVDGVIDGFFYLIWGRFFCGQGFFEKNSFFVFVS